MATLNTILAIAESVTINDQKFVGQVLSRNQRISTSEILSVQPFAFEMKPMHRSPFGVVWIMLAIKMIFASEPNKTIGVVDPAFFRRDVEFWTILIHIGNVSNLG